MMAVWNPALGAVISMLAFTSKTVYTGRDFALRSLMLPMVHGKEVSSLLICSHVLLAH